MTDEGLRLWETLRAKITHEDSWIQQRVNWLLLSNAFLFAAYAALLAVDPGRSKALWSLRGCTLILVPLLGVTLSTFVYLGLEGARAAIDSAINEGATLLSKTDQKKLPRLYSKGKALSSGRVASGGITISIGTAWLLVFIATVCMQLSSLAFRK